MSAPYHTPVVEAIYGFARSVEVRAVEVGDQVRIAWSDADELELSTGPPGGQWHHVVAVEPVNDALVRIVFAASVGTRQIVAVRDERVGCRSLLLYADAYLVKTVEQATDGPARPSVRYDVGRPVAMGGEVGPNLRLARTAGGATLTLRDDEWAWYR